MIKNVFFSGVVAAVFYIGLGQVAHASIAKATGALSTVASTSAVIASTTATTTIATSTPITGRAVVEKLVREYFADIPVMIEIARCESNFRQFTDSGLVMRGGNGGVMVGVFQFFESVHAKTARALGFDITTIEGNLAYARHLYKQEGTTPWISCVPAAVPVMSAANKELQIKLLTKVVELLTELLKIKLAEGR